MPATSVVPAAEAALSTLRIDGRDDADGTTIVLGWGDGLPAILHYGARLAPDTDLDALARSRTPPLPNATLDVVPAVSLSPEPARGFMGHPGLLAQRDGGRTGGRLALVDHEADAHRARFTARDARRGLLLECRLALDPETDVATFRSILVNEAEPSHRDGGAGELRVEWLAAPVLPVPGHFTERLRFQGRWCAEFDAVRRPIGRGMSADENRRGRTSHESFPGTVLLAPQTSHAAGDAIGAHLAWSGNHRLVVERTAEGVTQFQAGRLDMAGEVRLRPGESVETPDLFLARSSRGTNGASAKFHHHVRARILSFPRPDRPRPVTVNTWEAVYFDHEMGRLKALADRAATVGAERFVLDDGWFGRDGRGRDDDTTSLGDWFVDARKYPHGLGPLVDHVTGLGMEFGLWVEPEMVNVDSGLFREHPDWVLGIDQELRNVDNMIPGRQQFLLDMTREEVRDHLYERLAALLSDHAIGYLKWDMNRNLVLPADRSGRPAARAQVEGLYALIDRIRATFPHVEIESCASGGARIDFEILERTHRFWASDSNDPVERMRIQMGFSHFLPPEVMGAHVGPAWCHTSGRGTRLPLRALVASWGHMGLELDLAALSDDELRLAGLAVERHKGDRDVWHGGRLHRLDHPDEALLAVMGVAPDGARARLVVTQLDRPRDTIPLPLRLTGLDAATLYRVRLETAPDVALMGNRAFGNPLMDGVDLSGAVLMEIGLQLPIMYAQTGLAIALDKA